MNENNRREEIIKRLRELYPQAFKIPETYEEKEPTKKAKEEYDSLFRELCIIPKCLGTITFTRITRVQLPDNSTIKEGESKSIYYNGKAYMVNFRVGRMEGYEIDEELRQHIPVYYNIRVIDERPEEPKVDTPQPQPQPLSKVDEGQKMMLGDTRGLTVSELISKIKICTRCGFKAIANMTNCPNCGLDIRSIALTDKNVKEETREEKKTIEEAKKKKRWGIR